MKPYQRSCQLPTTNLMFPVVKHWFLASVFSLSDDSLTRPENLIFKDAANLTEHCEFNDVYSEVDSGTAYWQFVESLLDPNRTIVIPIIQFGDGTVVDGAMHKPMEPFMFTLGIFWHISDPIWQHDTFWHTSTTICTVCFHQNRSRKETCIGNSINYQMVIKGVCWIPDQSFMHIFGWVL